MTTGPQRRPQMYTRLRTQDLRSPDDPDYNVEIPASEATPMSFRNTEEWDRFALNPVINGQQMRTLVDPEQHWEHMTHSIDVSGYDYSKEQMREAKLEEAQTPVGRSHVHGAGIYDWVSRGERMRNPIEVIVNPGEEGYGQGEGHHRAAAVAERQAETGEPHLLKFKATTGHPGASAGTRYDDYYDDEEYEPTPPPTSQRTTQRKMTPSNQPRLEAPTSRREAFTWNPHMRPAGRVWKGGDVYETPPPPPGIAVRFGPD